MGVSLATRIKQFVTSVRHNGSTLEVRESYVEFFDRAKSSVYAVTGEIEADVFASEAVVSAIREAVIRDNHSVMVTIVTGPAPHVESVEALLEFVDEDNFTLLQIDSWPGQHPLVTDERHIRISESHPPGSAFANREHRADILDNEPHFAQRVVHDILEATKEALQPSVAEWREYVRLQSERAASPNGA